jgi:hypothetical protein
MRKLAAFSLSLLTAALIAVPVEPHTLDPDLQDVGARLQYCPYDLFRAQQADGTYLAEVADDLLLDFYSGILEQSLRRNLPPTIDVPTGSLSVPARRLLDNALNLIYSHGIPVRLRRDAKLVAYFDLVRSEWTREELQRVIGARRVRERRRRIPGEVAGAAVLAVTAADFHERVAWGPQRILDTIESARDPASWSLDGTPLAVPQFEALVAELADAVGAMTARQKIDLVGGHCLHFHPPLPGMTPIAAADGTDTQDQQQVDPPTFYDEIWTGDWWDRIWPVTWPGGGGPVDTGGGNDGNGTEVGGGDPGNPDPPPAPQPPQSPPECFAGVRGDGDAFPVTCSTTCPGLNDCLACCDAWERALVNSCRPLNWAHFWDDIAGIFEGTPPWELFLHPSGACEHVGEMVNEHQCQQQCSIANEVG